MVQIDWGDSTSTEPIPVSQLNDSFAGIHQYVNGGTFTISATLTDGGLNSVTSSVVAFVDEADRIAIVDDDGDGTSSITGNVINGGANGSFQHTGWFRARRQGYLNDVRFMFASNGSETATWQFDDLIPGVYQIAATWSPNHNRATNAPYSIFDGNVEANSLLSTAMVNQELAPDDFDDSGANWEVISTATVTGNRLSVQLTNKANQFVIADAVRIERIDAPALQIRPLNSVQSEADSETVPLTFAVTRTGDTSQPTAVDFEIGGKSVADADDFGGVLPAGTISFLAGESTKTLIVDVSGDQNFEVDESFEVTLFNPANGEALTIPNASGTILNDDSGLSIDALDAIKPEGSDGSTSTLTFAVNRLGNTDGPASATFAVTGGGQSFVNADDFADGSFPNGVVSFDDGESSKIVSVDIRADSDVEGDESFVVTISNSVGAEIIVATAEGTVQDDDSVVRIIDDGDAGYQSHRLRRANNQGYLGDVEFAWRGNGSKSATWSFANLEPGFFEVAVTWTANRNRATDAPFSVFDAADVNGQSLQTIEVNQRLAPGDFNDEGTNWHRLGIVSITGDGLTVQLTNDADRFVIADAVRIQSVPPPPPVLSIEAVDSSMLEGDVGTTDYTFTVTRFGDTSESASVEYGVSGSGSNAADSTDFDTGVFPAGIINFVEGQTSAEITLSIVGDLDVEPDESFTVSLSNSVNATIETSTAVGTIVDDDAFIRYIDDNGDGINADLGDGFIDGNVDGSFTTNNWRPFGGQRNRDDVTFIRRGSGNRVTTWTFGDLEPGNYRVSTTWSAQRNRATDAPYNVYDGTVDPSNLMATIDVNQELVPSSFTDSGVSFQDIGTFAIT